MRVLFLITLIIIVNSLNAQDSKNLKSDSLQLTELINDATDQIEEIEERYEADIEPILIKLEEINKVLKVATGQFKSDSARDSYIIGLSQKIQQTDQLQITKKEYEIKSLKIRYRKGVEIIKLLYEKIVDLDHHFTSLNAQQSLLSLSNPHSYPDFSKNLTSINNKLKKKNKFVLPDFLQSNPFITTALSISSILLSDQTQTDKNTDFNKVACILDFTAKMSSSLNIIYFETEYLKEENIKLKSQCENLFNDYVSLIDYENSLTYCRKNDDWESLYGKLETKFDTIQDLAIQSNTSLYKGTVGEINAKFSINKLVTFINQYNTLITQINDYYIKFQKIASTYDNEEKCSAWISEDFNDLKKEIEETISKFDFAYNLPEVKGSKLKSLLYGELEQTDANKR